MFWITTNPNAIIATGIDAFAISNPDVAYPKSLNVLAIYKTPELARKRFCP